MRSLRTWRTCRNSTETNVNKAFQLKLLYCITHMDYGKCDFVRFPATGLLFYRQNGIELQYEHRNQKHCLLKNGDVIFESDNRFQIVDLLSEYQKYITDYGHFPDKLTSDPQITILSYKVTFAMERYIELSGYNQLKKWQQT